MTLTFDLWPWTSIWFFLLWWGINMQIWWSWVKRPRAKGVPTIFFQWSWTLTLKINKVLILQCEYAIHSFRICRWTIIFESCLYTCIPAGNGENCSYIVYTDIKFHHFTPVTLITEPLQINRNGERLMNRSWMVFSQTPAMFYHHRNFKWRMHLNWYNEALTN